jgi:hypothetical protein
MRKNLLNTAAVLCTMASMPAMAQEIYIGAGLPGVMAGVAFSPNESVTLRADYASMGEGNRTLTEDGIEYKGKVKVARTGLFADWFFWGSGRITAGATLNQIQGTLRFSGSGKPVNIGGTTVIASSSDTLDITLKLPATTPYIGLGYGHHQSNSGFGFLMDLGVSVGRAQLDAKASASLLAKVGQSNIDKELETVREGAGKINVIPQISLGVSYRF